MTESPHPLDPLRPEEITQAAHIVRKAFPKHEINFRVITLKEPPKEELTVYLSLEHVGTSPLIAPPRVAMVHVLISEAGSKSMFLDLRVNLDSSTIVHREHMVGRHSFIDPDYMQEVEKVCLADSRVQAQIAEMKLPAKSKVVVEAWAYATDGMNDMTGRVTMCYFYLQVSENPNSNHYAYPLDVCAEVSEKLEVTKIYRLPSGEHDRINHTEKLFNNERVHTTSEYHPDFIKARTTTQPLQLIQPNGPSFKITGNHVSWENWSFRVGFNYREGMTIHDVRFNHCSLFYRLSLAEMFVPYGDSRSPYQRKGAFDLGNDGAGICANSLHLGCDCLGHIKYFDGWHNTSKGEPLKLPNVICCHEVDDGILWKHTNFRVNNPVVARSRVLILQTVVTVTNYEYIFAFHFKQDASIHYEVRATGILSTAPIDIGDKVPYGTIVAPGVMAPYHQHLFSLRIDPAIDGQDNSLVVEETIPMPYDQTQSQIAPTHTHTHSNSNPFGVGFTIQSHTIQQEGHLDLDHATNRTFKIVNESRMNLTTKTPVSYQLVPHYSQTLLAHPASYHARRAEFATHSIWVTRHHDDELYPAGTWTMQSAGREGIASWIRGRRIGSSPPPPHPTQNNGDVNSNGTQAVVTTMGNDDNDAELTAWPSSQQQTSTTNETNTVRHRDIVIWHTFGSTHIPRIEDWPVMPCEKMGVTLKPVNFFLGNPALDVPVNGEAGGGSVGVGGGCGSGSGRGGAGHGVGGMNGR